MEDPTGVAVKASIEVALIGCGSGDLYRSALAVTTPQQCAAVLIDCLAAFPKDISAEDSSNRELLTVDEAATRFGVSKCMVYRLVRQGELDSHRIGSAIRIKPATMKRYLEDGDYRPTGESLFS